MPSGPFLFVRFPAKGLLVAESTVGHPGARIDSVHERDGNEFGGFHQTVSWVRGLPAEGFDALVRGLAARFGSVEVLSRDATAHDYSFRMRVAVEDPNAKTLVFLTRFVGSFPLWWDHVSAGRYEARAQVESLERGIEEGQRIQAFYRKAGVRVETEVRALPPSEAATLERLSDWRRAPPKAR